MIVNRLRIKDVLGIEELDLELGSAGTLVQGGEGRGKTSLIDALRMALEGKCDRPVVTRTGADAGALRVEIGDGPEKITVERDLDAEGKTKRLLVARNGRKTTTRPQEFLDGLISPYRLDLSALFGADEKTRRRMLLGVVKIPYEPEERIEGVDYSAHPLEVIAAEEAALVEQRRLINADAEHQKHLVEETAAKVPAGFDAGAARLVNSRDLMERLVAARRNNERVEMLQDELEQAAAKVARLRGALEEAERECDAAGKARVAVVPVDLAPLEEELAQLDTVRRYLTAYDTAATCAVTLQNLQEMSERLTERIENIRRRPAALLAQANVAIPGLGVDAQGRVTVDDRPVANLCGGEKVKLAARFAMATESELPLVLIDGLEALDTTNRELLFRELAAAGIQWVAAERTDGEFEVVTLEAGKALAAGPVSLFDGPPVDIAGGMDPGDLLEAVRAGEWTGGLNHA